MVDPQDYDDDGMADFDLPFFPHCIEDACGPNCKLCAARYYEDYE